MTTQAASNAPAGAQTFDAIYPGTAQKVSLSTAHAESSAFGNSTTCVEVCSDADCFIRIGSAPVATSDGTSTFLPAKVKRLYGCNPGDKISGIVASSTANLYVTEGA